MLVPTALRAEPCEQLLGATAPTSVVTLAKLVSEGDFTPAGTADTLHDLPSFCRVAATLKPSSDSDIRIEVWLPAAHWNGKFLAVGSGGWGGSLAYAAMADALRRGYATSATDDGHTGPSASFVVGHPEKFIDFAYRAEHEMTTEAKSLILAFYGRAPRYSFWSGCSGGGREALLQASRYPEEFDGIIAGDPANIRRNAWALERAVETLKTPGDYIPPQKYPMIHRAVLEACDADDGLKDGLIEDPESCQVDFKKLQCENADGPNCLTARQVHTAQALTSPVTTATGQILVPRVEPGTELRWGRLAGGPEPADLFVDEFRYVVYKDPEWDWRTFNLARDSARAHAIDRNVDELNPDLTTFARHGGKLLLYHGWADQQVAPGFTVDFYKAVLDVSAVAGQAWVRLFMAPGMAHCSGGEGPDTFDALTVLERWVEQSEAPKLIIASHKTAGKVDRTRPLCPYPEIARYKGTGSIDEASDFTCSSSR
ncbi:tannase/feruloyl esterase family alpha/beta hydrolase [Acidipila sp. EB88]|nr:tannase/feruloyl esterase family alpha/beta hydrolase [Acidipila sp. EB88]